MRADEALFRRSFPAIRRAGMILDVDNDPYHDAAFIHILLVCESCPKGSEATLESDELQGQPTFPADGWDVALGNEARRRGWLIEYNDNNPFAFTVLCPECAKRQMKF